MKTNPTFTGFDEFCASGDKSAPPAGLIASGYLPLEMLPAQQFNWLMSRASLGVTESETYVDNINKEINAVLTQEGLSPDNSTIQLLAALNSGFRDTKANGTSDLDSIGTTGAYSYSGSTTNAPSTSAGLLFHINVNGGSTSALQLAFDPIAPNSWIRGKSSSTWGSWVKLWTAANDGTDSGLDADTLGGTSSSAFVKIETYETAIDYFSSLAPVFVLSESADVLRVVAGEGFLLQTNTFSGRGYKLGTDATYLYGIGIDCIKFADETTINTSASLPTNLARMGGASSRLKGYALGGNNGAALDPRTTVQGITFPTEVSFTLGNVLSLAREGPTGLNSAVKGYAVGGRLVGGGWSDEIDGIVFSTEVLTNPTAVLSTEQGHVHGYNAATRGFVPGGNADLGTRITKLTFSSETSATLSAVLPTSIFYNGGFASSIRGYSVGGMSTVPLSSILGLRFDTEAEVSVSATLSSARAYSIGVSKESKGYALGGYTTLFTVGVNTIDAMTFATETVGTLSATLPVVEGSGTGVQSCYK